METETRNSKPGSRADLPGNPRGVRLGTPARHRSGDQCKINVADGPVDGRRDLGLVVKGGIDPIRGGADDVVHRDRLAIPVLGRHGQEDIVEQELDRLGLLGLAPGRVAGLLRLTALGHLRADSG